MYIVVTIIILAVGLPITAGASCSCYWRSYFSIVSGIYIMLLSIHLIVTITNQKAVCIILNSLIFFSQFTSIIF
jgi:hypothetical protein